MNKLAATRVRAWIVRLAVGACMAAGVVAPVLGDPDVNGARQAVAAFGQLRQNLQAMQGAMGAPLGPYELATQCTWCSEHAWWGLGTCTQETTRKQSTRIDFEWTRARVGSLIGQAQALAANFPAAYAPAQAWLRGVPTFNATFQQASDIVLKVRDEIKAGQGPNDGQKVRVTQALQAVVTGLQASRQQLDASTGSLASYLQRQSTVRAQMSEAIGGAARSADEAWTKYKQDTNTWQCHDGLDARFNQMKAHFTGSTQRISTSFQNVDASSRAAEQALATMTATLVSAQGDYQSILKQVQAAQKDQLGSFIEQLHLDVARRQWQQLADYAAQVQ